MKLRSLSIDEVTTVTITGWLAGTALASVGYTVFVLVGGFGSEPGLALFAVQMLLLLLFAVGLVSTVFYLPNAFIVVALVRWLGVTRATAVLLILTAATAWGLAFRTMQVDMPMIAANWFMAPVFGIGTAAAYLKVCCD